MLGALIIVFREVIEAGLIVGIVLAVTQGVPGSRPVIAVGVAAGVVGASLVAAFAGAIGEALAGVGQEIFNASILLIAVVMLIWHNVWMASHGRELAAEVKRVGEAVRTGSSSILALGVVCAVAVMREGSEIALFMYGLVASAGSTTGELVTGSILGLAAGVGVTAAHLSRPGDNPAAPPVRRDDGADQLPRRGTCGAGSSFPAAGRGPDDDDPNGLGHLGHPLGHEPVRAGAAHADRLFGRTVRAAGPGLYADACGYCHFDEDGRIAPSFGGESEPRCRGVSAKLRELRRPDLKCF